jgi:hypothetical protein
MTTYEVTEQPVLSVAFAPDGRQAICGGADAAICLWPINSGQEAIRAPK